MYGLNKHDYDLHYFLVLIVTVKVYAVTQACQTQTTSRAANATKTDKRAAKVFKKS